MSHLIVTGAAGFIGGAVVTEAIRRGFRVTVLARPASDRTRIPTGPFVEIVEYERLNTDFLIARLNARRPTAFVHCAWRGVAARARSAAFQILENIPVTLDSVALAGAIGCRTWVGMGSQAEYGVPNARVIETDACCPVTSYGKAKLAAGIAALAACDVLQLEGSWVRVFSIYGPGDSPDCLIPHVIAEMRAGRRPRLTRCEQKWDYLYIDDAARAIVDLSVGSAGGIVNLGSSRTIVLRDMIAQLRELLGTDIQPDFGARPYSPESPMHLEADISHISALCGWQPHTSLAEGLTATIASMDKA